MYLGCLYAKNQNTPSGDSYLNTYGIYTKNGEFIFPKCEKLNELCHFETYNNIDLKLIGIFAKNCVEWVISDIACQLDSITTVTLYATLGQGSFKYILDQTEINTLFLSPDLIDTLIKYKKSLNFDSIKNIILFDLTLECKDEHFTKLKEEGFNVLSFKKEFIEKKSQLADDKLEMSQPDTVMTICYTSGTTGNPKGAMILQRNFIACIEGSVFGAAFPIDDKSVHFSYLPLAHVMERMIFNGSLCYGTRATFLSGKFKYF